MTVAGIFAESSWIIISMDYGFFTEDGPRKGTEHVEKVSAQVT